MQHNPTIGDFDQVLDQLTQAFRLSQKRQSELIVTPELAIGGYPARDLWLSSSFKTACQKALSQILAISTEFPKIGLLVGTPLYEQDRLYNAVVLIENGQILFTQYKTRLPTYDVFDEARYFTSNPSNGVLIYKGLTLGVLICEDAWGQDAPVSYSHDPVSDLLETNLDLILHISASPYDQTKIAKRHHVVSSLAKRANCPVIFVNQVGLQDDMLFDGGSFYCDKTGTILDQYPQFEAGIFSATTEPSAGEWPPVPSNTQQELFQAITLGIRDYVTKSGFEKVVLGLSGGIDSALVAALAVKALGPDKVTGLLMPSPYSSTGSLDDALALAKNLGIHTYTVPIHNLYTTALQTVETMTVSPPHSLTDQNLQARIRGLLVMAYSNETQALALATGNKSELAVGYCTIYGDMNGALTPIGDLYKTQVVALSHWINETFGDIIPKNTLTKPPSAELKPGQLDQDTLPPYDILDAILSQFVDENRVVTDHDPVVVNQVLTLLKRNEYKRRQAPIIIRLSQKAFGAGRRLPVLCRS